MKILNKTLKALLALSLVFSVSAAEEIKVSATDCDAKLDSGKRTASPKSAAAAKDAVPVPSEESKDR